MTRALWRSLAGTGNGSWEARMVLWADDEVCLTGPLLLTLSQSRSSMSDTVLVTRSTTPACRMLLRSMVSGLEDALHLYSFIAICLQDKVPSSPLSNPFSLLQSSFTQLSSNTTTSQNLFLVYWLNSFDVHDKHISSFLKFHSTFLKFSEISESSKNILDTYYKIKKFVTLWTVHFNNQWWC